MSDDVPLRQILGPFKEYRQARSKENETTIDEDKGEIVLRTFPVDDISANEFGYSWKVKTVKMAEELLDKTKEARRPCRSAACSKEMKKHQLSIISS